MPTPIITNPALTGLVRPRNFADGGKVETTDELLARMASKYGLSNPRAAQPAPTPVQQPQAQPAPQRQGVMGAADALKGRREQIDKASGYARGGKIKGPGTPTSDSIPARVKETGEQIKVSTGERILSAAQDKFLAQVAKNAGYDSLDAMLEDGTGKPVGPTIKAGKRAAATGLSPEDEAKRDPFAYRPEPAIADANGRTAAAIAAPPTLGGGAVARTEPAGTLIKSDLGLTRPFSASDTAGNIDIPRPGTPIVFGSNQGDAGISRPTGLDPKIFGVPGITKTIGADGGLTYSGQGIPAPDNSPARSAMDIYRSEAAIRGLDPNTFDRVRGGPTGTNFKFSSISDTVAGANGMPSGLSARQQANFLGQQQQTQAILRGQDLNHEAALSGQAVEAQRQTRLDGRDAARFGLDARLADQADQRLGLESRRLDLSADRQTTRGGLTLNQDRQNQEIDAARERVAGLTADDIKRKTQQFSTTGRENPDFDPTLAKAASLANRRKIGADDLFDQRQQGQPQPQGGDLATRFQGDKSMAGHRLGKQTDQGTEVYDAQGRLIGHYQ